MTEPFFSFFPTRVALTGFSVCHAGSPAPPMWKTLPVYPPRNSACTDGCPLIAFLTNSTTSSCRTVTRCPSARLVMVSVSAGALFSAAISGANGGSGFSAGAGSTGGVAGMSVVSASTIGPAGPVPRIVLSLREAATPRSRFVGAGRFTSGASGSKSAVPVTFLRPAIVTSSSSIGIPWMIWRAHCLIARVQSMCRGRELQFGLLETDHSEKTAVKV